MAVGLLTRRGHEVQIANNGLEMLAALESASFDIILMDIQMSEMGGVEATLAIREREALTGRHTRIVAMTAHAMKGDRERYLASGMDGYLCKPIDPATLFAEVERQPSPAAEIDADRVSVAGPVDIEEMRQRLSDDALVSGVIGDVSRGLSAPDGRNQGGRGRAGSRRNQNRDARAGGAAANLAAAPDR